MKSTEIEFWDSRFRAGKTPWDFGGVPSALATHLQTARPGRVLIPGCGSGYEVRAFHESRWDVTAVDFSPAAVGRARRLLGELAQKVLLADFFEHDFQGQKFDVIYERTFLCSLPPATWTRYIHRVTTLLTDEGKLMGLFFYGRQAEPPPYPLNEKKAQELFGSRFRGIADAAVDDSPLMFAGQERWQIWQKKN
jgi:SAM-dependent methyltransferase